MSRKKADSAGSARVSVTRWRRLLFIFIAALAIRIAYFIHISDNVSFQIIALDSELFDQKALEILHGNFWGDQVFYSAPLYPYFLAFIYAIFGPGFLMVRVVQILLGSLTAVLIVRLAESLFEEPVPLVAGLVGALYAPFVFYGPTILGTTLAVFLATLSILLFSLSLSGGRRRDLLILLAGISIGLTSLARPNTVLVLPLWVVCLLFFCGKRRWIRPSAILLLGGLVVIGSVTVRNAIVGHDFVPISSHGGINFWIGNHPRALGTFDLPPGIRGTPEQVNLIDSTRLATQAVGRRLKPSEVSTYWFRKGWEYIRDNPGEYADLLSSKVRMFWNRYEIPLNVNFHFFERASPFLRVPLMHFGVISSLGLLGIALSLAGWKRFLPAYALVAVYFVSAVAFFVSGRYRLPAVPVLIVFASYSGWWVYRRSREKRWKAVAIAALVLAALAVQANIPVKGFSLERSFAREFYYLAAHYQSKEQLPQALAYYERSILHNPQFWLAYNGRGVCLSNLGRLEQAIESFQTAIDLAPTRAEPWANLGIALATHGRVAEAIPAWEKALQLDPQHQTSRTNLHKARRMLEEQGHVSTD